MKVIRLMAKVAIVSVTGLVYVGCTTTVQGNVSDIDTTKVISVEQDSTEKDSTEKDIGEVKMAEVEYINYAEEVSVTPGSYNIGSDIMPGKYIIEASGGNKLVSIYGGVGYSEARYEVKLNGSDGSYKSIATVELAVGEVLDVEDTDDSDSEILVLLAPYNPNLERDNIYRGSHLVGRDIPSGLHGLKSNKDGVVKLYTDGFPYVNDSIRNTKKGNPFQLILKDGQVLVWEGDNELELIDGDPSLIEINFGDRGKI